MAPAHAGAGIGENDVMSADPGLVQQAKQLLETLQAKNLSVVTAESCIAGMLATLLSEAPGAAELCTEDLLLTGSEQVQDALRIARSARAARCCLPRSGDRDGRGRARQRSSPWRSPVLPDQTPMKMTKPVGLVCIAVAREGHPARHLERRYGDIGRDGVRKRAIADTLSELKEMAAQD
jgi:nicotinamide-nucleotide amidase